MTQTPTFEVCLGDLPPGASYQQLVAFCQALENAMLEAGDEVLVVPTSESRNPKTPEFLAWAWPTQEQWDLALRKTLGVLPSPRKP